MTDLAPPPAIVRIVTDGGGTLGERKVMTDYFRRVGVRVEIAGTCASACTWFFTLPTDQVCVSYQAWIGWHDPATDTVKWERGRDLIARGFARECGR